jgi:signal transduction histidine kinase
MISTAGLAVALAGGAAVVLFALRASLTRGLDDAARSAALQTAALVRTDRLPDPVPVGSGTITIQVLGADGQITDVSAGADRLVPLLPPGTAATAASSGAATLLGGAPLGMSSPLEVVAVPAGDGQLVLAAASYGSVRNSLVVMETILAIAVPLLLALLAFAIWLVTGSMLRPIGQLRRDAAEVTRAGPPRALPLPPARDEIRALAVTLNDMLARLGAAQQQQRDLVNDTAHELRSPIASIRAQLEVALDHPEAQDWLDTARDVHADTLRLSRLTEDLLLLARLGDRSDAQSRRNSRPVDVSELCLTVVPQYAQARIPVGAAVSPAVVVTADPGALRRLLVNLLDNAVRYAASGVSLALSADGDHAVLTVTDDGPGIPPGDRERVFGRFTRLDDARTRAGDTEGAGLGLAIVRATAQAHGGQAWLEDAVPGLCAIVRLPLKR